MASVNGISREQFSICVRLKHGITTIFLLKTPYETFDDLKNSLLEVLKQRYPDGYFYEQPIPDSLDDLMLGAPRNPEDLQEGFGLIEAIDFSTDTLEQHNIKDGSVLSFGFTEEHGADFPPLDELFNVTIPTFESTFGDANSGA